MLKKDNRYKVLEIFFDDPLPKGTGFQLREISRGIRLAPKSVKNYLEELEKDNLIVQEKHRVQGYPLYYANRDSDYFKFLKKVDMQKKITESSLLQFLSRECMPECMVLFGSASRGEDTKESDIDLYLQCKQKDLDLKKYEKEIKRKINLFFEEDFNKLSEELKTNIINGIKLRGYLKVRWKE